MCKEIWSVCVTILQNRTSYIAFDLYRANMAIEIKTGEPNFFYEPYVDMQNRLRTKIACVISFDTGEGKYYAYGSAVQSFDDNFNQWAGENIAYQRADKVLQMFEKVGNVRAVNAYIEETTIPTHMRLLIDGNFKDLEGRLLPFRDTSPQKEGQNKESADASEEK